MQLVFQATSPLRLGLQDQKILNLNFILLCFSLPQLRLKSLIFADQRRAIGKAWDVTGAGSQRAEPQLRVSMDVLSSARVILLKTIHVRRFIKSFKLSFNNATYHGSLP